MDLIALGLLSSIFMLTVGSLSGIFSKCLSWREKWAFLWLWVYLLSRNLFPPWGSGSCSFSPSNHCCSLITPCSHLSATLPSPGSSIFKKKKCCHHSCLCHSQTSEAIFSIPYFQLSTPFCATPALKVLWQVDQWPPMPNPVLNLLDIFLAFNN